MSDFLTCFQVFSYIFNDYIPRWSSQLTIFLHFYIYSVSLLVLISQITCILSAINCLLSKSCCGVAEKINGLFFRPQQIASSQNLPALHSLHPIFVYGFFIYCVAQFSWASPSSNRVLSLVMMVSCQNIQIEKTPRDKSLLLCRTLPGPAAITRTFVSPGFIISSGVDTRQDQPVVHLVILAQQVHRLTGLSDTISIRLRLDSASFLSTAKEPVIMELHRNYHQK